MILQILTAGVVRGDVIVLTTESFDTVITNGPVFVKFFSPHCHHCQRTAPVWEKLGNSAPSYPQPFSVGDVDCTVETQLCDRFGIRGVPSLIYFRDGRMYKYSGIREYHDFLKFGAGDYQLSQDSSEIPPAHSRGIAEAAKYTLAKFVKDLHAILRFNIWVALFIFAIGFVGGVLLTFLVMVATMRPDSYAGEKLIDLASSVPQSQTEAEKSSEAKKDD